MTMRALKQFDYSGLGRRIEQDEKFEPCSDTDCYVLTVAQLAVEIDDEYRPPKKNKKRYQRADMRPVEDDE
jgi:hypothetical protein